MAEAEAISLPRSRGKKSPWQLQQLPDEEVVVLAKDGDETAMEHLLRKFKSVVLFKSHSYFLIGADRDDMIQEGMIGLFKAVRNFRPDKAASFRTFADVCITRHMIAAVKSGANQREFRPVPLSQIVVRDPDSGDDVYDYLPNPCGPDPESVVVSRETARVLRRQLRKVLSNFEWEVWIRFARGYSYQEIADELGRTPKRVDNALCKVRCKVKKFLLPPGQSAARQNRECAHATPTPPDVRQAIWHNRQELSLQETDKQILDLWAQGLTYQAIADAVGLMKKGVQYRIRLILSQARQRLPDLMQNH